MRFFLTIFFSIPLFLSQLQAGWVLPAIDIPTKPEAGEFAQKPQISIGTAGDAIIIWHHTIGFSNHVCSVTQEKETGNWIGKPVTALLSSEETIPQVGVDASGKAVAVWQHHNGAFYALYATTYDGTDWSTENFVLSSNTSGYPYTFSLGVGETGNAVVVWQLRNKTSRIQAKAFNSSTNDWTSATFLTHAPAGFATVPQVGVDADGNAVAVWQLRDPSKTIFSVQATTYDRLANTWNSTPETLMSLEVPLEAQIDVTLAPQVAVNPSGKAVAIWQLYDKNHAHHAIQAKNYAAQTGWSALSTLTDAVAIDATSPQVGIDDSGDAIAVWQAADTLNSGSFIQVTNYDRSTGWNSSPTSLTAQDATVTSASSPQIGVSPSGSAVIAWSLLDNTLSNYSIQATNIDSDDNSISWSETITTLGFVETAATSQRFPCVGIDPSGKAIVVWQVDQPSPYSTILRAETYLPSSILANLPSPVVTSVSPDKGTIGTEVTINGENFNHVTNVLFGSSPATIVTQNSATSMTATAPAQPAGPVFVTVSTPSGTSPTSGASRYTYQRAENEEPELQTQPLAPSDFKGQAIRDRFFFHTDINHVLTWTPSADASVVEYRLFEGDLLLKTIPATEPCTITIHGRDERQTYTYKLIAINEAGLESNPTTLTLY